MRQSKEEVKMKIAGKLRTIAQRIGSWMKRWKEKRNLSAKEREVLQELVRLVDDSNMFWRYDRERIPISPHSRDVHRLKREGRTYLVYLVFGQFLREYCLDVIPDEDPHKRLLRCKNSAVAQHLFDKLERRKAISLASPK